MIDTSKPIYKRVNGDYVATRTNGDPARIAQGEHGEEYDQIEQYLAEHDITPQPEPSYIPTPAEQAAAQRAANLASLAALDARAVRPLRAIEAARKTASDAIAAAQATDPPDLVTIDAAEAKLDAVMQAEGAQLAAIETEAAALRAQL